jgi:diguanylate cyclase (GGDEF)-like protein
MNKMKYTLESNAKLLKTKVNTSAIYGLLIAIITILIATIAASYQMSGSISIHNLISAQRNNVALWVLNFMPFLFMFWGQSVSSMVSYTAGAMIVDQTSELRMQTTELESKVLYEASHDSLTDLPNRILFVDRLTQAINKESKENMNMLGVLIVNINDFREINNAFGQFNADRLLKQFAQRLVNTVPDSCTVARLSGDEFGLLLLDIKQKDKVIDVITSIQKALDTYFILDGVVIDINASIGATLYPSHGADADTLVQRANVAIFNARQDGKTYALYDTEMDKNNPNRLILMSELKRAIEGEQLMVYYQPKVNIKSGVIIGAEALVRWNHPSFGMMNAEKFIPIAERTGLIKSLTAYVLKEVIAQVAQWHKRGVNIDVAVNLSAVDIVDIELPYMIESLLNVHELEPKHLKLELIESAYLTDQKRAIEVINRLSELGVQISIDDFGTGYSSFVYLTDLPINEIKIDKSFVMNMSDDSKKRDIVNAIIKLADALKLSVVAEGVCNESIYELLKGLECAMGQGYFFSKAISADQLETLLGSQVAKLTGSS